LRAAKPKRCLTGAGPWLIHGMRTPAAAREGAISRISAVREVGRTPRDGRAPSGAAEIPAHSGATGTKVSLLFTWPTPFRQGVVSSLKNTGRSLRTLVGEGNFFFWMTSVPPARRGPSARPVRVLRPGGGPPWTRPAGRQRLARRAACTRPGSPGSARGPAHLAVRTRPSCTTDTTSSPASVKT
jgi:hypothetical protein